MGKSFTYNYLLRQRLNGGSVDIGFHKWAERTNKIRFMLEKIQNGDGSVSGKFEIIAQTQTGKNKITRELENLNARYQWIQIYGSRVRIKRSEIEVDASLEKDKLFVKCQ